MINKIYHIRYADGTTLCNCRSTLFNARTQHRTTLAQLFHWGLNGSIQSIFGNWISKMDLNETCLVTKEFFVVNINNNKRRREVSAQQAGFKLVYHYFTLYIIALWAGTCQVNKKTEEFRVLIHKCSSSIGVDSRLCWGASESISLNDFRPPPSMRSGAYFSWSIRYFRKSFFVTFLNFAITASKKKANMSYCSINNNHLM